MNIIIQKDKVKVVSLITMLYFFLLFIDIDECSNGNACGEKAYCVNNDGSFWCLCEPGYNGDPFKKCEGKMAILYTSS